MDLLHPGSERMQAVVWANSNHVSNRRNKDLSLTPIVMALLTQLHREEPHPQLHQHTQELAHRLAILSWFPCFLQCTLWQWQQLLLQQQMLLQRRPCSSGTWLQLLLRRKLKLLCRHMHRHRHWLLQLQPHLRLLLLLLEQATSLCQFLFLCKGQHPEI